MDTNKKRYVIEQREGYGIYEVVVDSETGKELCDAGCQETPEDASVRRHFSPLLSELNYLAEELRVAKAQVASLKEELQTARQEAWIAETTAWMRD